ncbi:hypothetical protein PMAYCL1PPCAC_00604 [Pristionchus mayeri]|uniref:Poly(A) RNA polymerase mitochondrial-like central palm domain-containing protein n=1 Tax=Pristionchus mayeri TaxID=1317129 RepID=A0AAN5C669_9BILA|nr:hypothetical protein PMAYCL1PPCAC_00604 [Pristionchus mayeri]
MSGGVGSPSSEADTSNSEKKVKKEKQVCALCNVEIPPGPGSLQKHEAGKRHERMRAQCDAVEALAKRSVFIKIAPASAASPVEMETDGVLPAARSSKNDPRLRLQREEIERVMARFGKIERVLCRAESGHYAIVEYGRDEDAKLALAARSVLMSCASLDAAGAPAPIKMATVLVMERRVNFSAAAPIEKQRINVDEIVDAISRLVVGPSEDAYTAAIDKVIRYMVLSEEQLRDRALLAARLEEELRKYFANPTLTIFGSSITSIGTVDSDIDMCLMLSSSSSSTDAVSRRMQFLHEQRQRDKYTLLTGEASQFREKKVHVGEMRRLSGPDRVRFVSKMLNEVRKECSWMGVQRPVVDCRLPIVRFLLDREVLVDLSIDNAIGVAKSEYIRDLIKMDSSGRLRRMLIGLRFWALSNGLFDAQEKEHKGHFNAYMLNLLAISFLQSAGALPPFHHMETPSYGGVGGQWRIDFVVPPYSLERVEIHAFMKSFFIHMTTGVSLRESVIVGRTGEQLSLAAFIARFPSIIERPQQDGAAQPSSVSIANQAAGTFEFAVMNVQDPIEQSHNVTATLNEKYVRRMRHMAMRSLHAMKGEKDSFVSILSIEKRLARDSTTPSTSADVSMEENDSSRNASTATSIDRPLTSMVESVKADATVSICYPRERPVSQSALMRASSFVFEKILLAEQLEDPSSSCCNSTATAAKRRRALSEEARERADQSRGGMTMREGRADGEGTSLVSAASPPTEPALYNWGIYALPSRLWIGRRNVKRKLQKERAGREELEIESMVSLELLNGGEKSATVPLGHTTTSSPLSPILIVRVEFAFHSDAMMMRFHRLEGAPLDLVNVSHFLEGNGLLPKYAHSLLPLLMEENEKRVAAPSSADNAENKRPTSGGKRKHAEIEEPMEM